MAATRGFISDFKEMNWPARITWAFPMFAAIATVVGWLWTKGYEVYVLADRAQTHCIIRDKLYPVGLRFCSAPGAFLVCYGPGQGKDTSTKAAHIEYETTNGCAGAPMFSP